MPEMGSTPVRAALFFQIFRGSIDRLDSARNNPISNAPRTSPDWSFEWGRIVTRIVRHPGFFMRLPLAGVHVQLPISSFTDD